MFDSQEAETEDFNFVKVNKSTNVAKKKNPQLLTVQDNSTMLRNIHKSWGTDGGGTLSQ